MLPNQAIASTPSAPRPSGAEGSGQISEGNTTISKADGHMYSANRYPVLNLTRKTLVLFNRERHAMQQLFC
jgi:hypothetical protein